MKKICLLLTAAAMLSSAAVAQSMSAGRAEAVGLRADKRQDSFRLVQAGHI